MIDIHPSWKKHLPGNSTQDPSSENSKHLYTSIVLYVLGLLIFVGLATICILLRSKWTNLHRKHRSRVNTQDDVSSLSFAQRSTNNNLMPTFVEEPPPSYDSIIVMQHIPTEQIEQSHRF